MARFAPGPEFSMPRFDIYLIKPTRYDDLGYPLQWWRSITPSNSLACMAGIVDDAVRRGVLAEADDVRVHAFDEANTYIDPAKIIRDIRKGGGRAFIGLVGVQSNQYPRAIDLAREFRAVDIPVCIGGFHVSGCLAMLKDMPSEMVDAQAMGISFFAGEAEDQRIDEVLLDAWAGRLQPLYNYLKSTPNLEGAPIPLMPEMEIRKNINKFTSFDLGRGCPFECSFCTIINVQGRKSRFRSPDDLEKIVRENAAIGIDRFIITDDNFARNKVWESFLDRLIALRDKNLKVRFAIQVDALAHRIPRFIDKCVQAGADQVFIGLENINADSLEAVKKRQNRIEDYRAMFLAWKKYPVLLTCGYIIGFPNDTKESILRDIDILKRELPIDTIYLNFLTPLPGSEDHKKMLEAGVWMDPDLNKYDLNHRVTKHPRMSDEEWDSAFHEAYRSFYTFEHMETVFRRMAALGSNKKLMTLHRLLAFRESARLEGVAKLESGFVRIRRRKQRRPTLPVENPLVFYARNAAHFARATFGMYATYWRLRLILRRIWNDKDRSNYRDLAITPVSEGSGHEMLATARTTAYAEKRMEKARLAS